MTQTTTNYYYYFTKYRLFDFTSKDSGARCWGRSLLVQGGQESTQLTFFGGGEGE